MSVNEAGLLQELDMLQGRITIPNRQASILEQPQGRDYRSYQERALPWIGGVAIIVMILPLALFYFTRGRITFEGGESGRKILRFNSFERFTLWMTATCFIVMAITGLIYIFGKQ